MASETEIERMVVRLVGDGASFERMLSQANASAQRSVNAFNRAGKQIEDIQTRLGKGGIALAAAGRRISLFMSTTFGALGYLGIKAGADFEAGFTGVRKTVNATEIEFSQLRDEFKQLATEVPIAIEEMLKVGEIAGQLGVQTSKIKDFTKVIAMLGVSTNLAGEEAATTLAKFSNITQMPQGQFSNLASALVALGNGSQIAGMATEELGRGSAATERDIAAMALRLAGAGTTIGMTVPQILGMATALSSVGLEAELGGTAMSRLFLEMQESVATGAENLIIFANTAGQTVEQFSEIFRTDATQAVMAFIKGLKNLDPESRVVAIKEMGVEGIRLTDVLLRASNASELLERTQISAGQAFEQNTALAEEATKKFKDFWSQTTLLKNELKLLGEDAFKVVETHLRDSVQSIKEVSVWLRSMDSGTKVVGIALLGFAAILGPILVLLGNLIWSTGQVIRVFTALKTASFGLAIFQSVNGWLWDLHTTVANMKWFPVVKGAAVASTALSTFRRVVQTTSDTIDATWTKLWRNTTTTSSGQGLLGGIQASTQSLLGYTGAVTQAARITGVTQKRLEKFATDFTIVTTTANVTAATLANITSVINVMAGSIEGANQGLIRYSRGFILVSRAAVNFILVTKTASAAVDGYAQSCARALLGTNAWTAGTNPSTQATRLLGSSVEVIDTTFRRFHPVLEQTSVTLRQRMSAGLSAAKAGITALIGILPTFTSLMAMAKAAVTFFTLEIVLLVGAGIYLAVRAFADWAMGVNDFNRQLDKTIELTGRLREAQKHSQNLQMIKTFQIEDPGQRRDAFNEQLLTAQKNAEGLKVQIKTVEAELANTNTLWNTMKVWGSAGFAGTGSAVIKGVKTELEAMKQAASDADAQVRNLETTIAGLGPVEKDKGLPGIPQADPQAEANQKTIDGITESLREQYETWGMTSHEVEIYRAAVAGAGEDVIQSLYSIADAIQNAENIKALEEFTAKLEEEAATFGMSAGAAELYRLKKKLGSGADYTAAEALVKKNEAMEAEKKLMEEGAALNEKYLTPLQKYTKELDTLKKMLDKKAITQQTYNAAVKEAKEELDKVKDKDVKLKFSVKGVEAVEAGSAEAMARINAFQAFKGGIQAPVPKLSKSDQRDADKAAKKVAAAARAAKKATKGAKEQAEFELFGLRPGEKEARERAEYQLFGKKPGDKDPIPTSAGSTVTDSGSGTSEIAGYLKTLVELATNAAKEGTVKVKMPGIKV